MNDLHPTIARVTARIIEKSKDSRRRYLDLIASEGEKGLNRACTLLRQPRPWLCCFGR